jgi:hypothetical protein
MELEVRSLPPATRKQLSQKVGTYKAILKSTEADYKRVREKEERAGLLKTPRAEWVRAWRRTTVVCCELTWPCSRSQVARLRVTARGWPPQQTRA